MRTSHHETRDPRAAAAPYAALDGSDGPLELLRFFDAILEEGLGLDAALERAAGLAAAVVGVSAEVSGGHRGFDGRGTLHSSVPDGALRRRLAGGGEVWVGRRGVAEPLDDTMLERLAIVCAVTLRQARGSGSNGFEVLEIALSPVADEVDRSRALRMLGIEPTAQVTVLAYDGPITDAAPMLDALRVETVVRVAPVGSVHAIVLLGDLPDAVIVPKGARVGASNRAAALDASRAWRQALTALRYALPSPHGRAYEDFVDAIIVPYDTLGAFAIIAEHLPIDRIGDNSDLAALDRLLAAPGGAEMLRTLEIVAATESIRKAATFLHLHHNSVAHRVARAEAELGFVISAPYGRPRLLLGLVMQRLRDNIERLGPL